MRCGRGGLVADRAVFDLDGQGVAAHATRFEEDGFACLDDVDQDPSQHVQGYESACA